MSNDSFMRFDQMFRSIGIPVTAYPQVSDWTIGVLNGIRLAVPLEEGTPDSVIADWLEDNNRSEAAKFLRRYME